MATAQRRRASLAVASWLLACLCSPEPAAAAGGTPALPLALRYQGRLYALDGDHQRLQLSLGCPGAGTLGVQHRVPPIAARCSAALSVTPAGFDAPAWRSEQVPAGQRSAPAAGDAALAREEASEPWFWFRLDDAPLPPGAARYALQLDMYCDGSTAPTLQSAVFVQAACDDGGSSSSAGASSSQGAAGVAARLQQALASARQRMAALLGLPAWQQPAQQEQVQPSSQPQHWPQQQHHQQRPQEVLAGPAAGRPSARRLAQASGLVPVVLLPASGNGTVMVDGYSGLARTVNSSQELPPVCGADGAPPPGYPADAACLSSPVLRTAGTQVALLLSLGAGAAIPENVLPADALTIVGNASLIGVTRGTDGRTMAALLRVGGTAPITVVVPEGALARYGIANAASNLVTIERDNTPPVPVITTPGATAVTYDTQIFFSISYGEPVLGSNPFDLFGWSGASRLDAVLDVAAGRLDVAVYVVDASQEADVTLWVNRGTVRDLVGNANTQPAVLTVKYRPKSSGLEGASIAANVFLGGSLVLCTTASYLSSAFLPYAPGVLGCGAISLVGYAQSIYFTGRVSAQWLPENYRQVANSFGWTVGEISLPWADSYPPGIDPGYAFPANPIVLTSKGQQVDASSYPALNPGDVGADPIVTVTGDLAPLPPESTAETTVLNDIPFLTPAEAQLVGAPPDPRRPAKPAPSSEPGSSPKAQPRPVVSAQTLPSPSPSPEVASPPQQQGQASPPPAAQPAASPPADFGAPPPEGSPPLLPPPASPSPPGDLTPSPAPSPAAGLEPPVPPADAAPPPMDSPSASPPSPPAQPSASPPADWLSPPAGNSPAAPAFPPPPSPDAAMASPPPKEEYPPSPPQGMVGAMSMERYPSPSPQPQPGRSPNLQPSPSPDAQPSPSPEPQSSPSPNLQPSPSSAAQRRRLEQAPTPRRTRRSLLQSAAADQPTFEGAVYIVASRGLQYITPDGQLDTEDVLAGSSAVQRAYDVMDAAGDGSAYPRQYYYDRLARTAFWTALFAFVVMAAHLAALGTMMWRHARIPAVMWFPRIETAVCLAILPGLAYGAAGLFNCDAGDIALGAVLLLLLPVSFLAVAFYLVWRWLQHPGLNKRRAIFVLRVDPLASQIAAGITPAASPAASPRDEAGAADANGSAAPAPGSAAAAAATVATDADAAARARRWSFKGLVRSLCGSRKLQGDWCAINLDSRFVHKYGSLFEATYGQAMVRRRATYDFDPVRGKIDRGALVPLPELATVSWRGKPLVEPHHLRSSAQLLAVARVLVLGAATSGVASLDSYIQCCLMVLLYGFYAIYLLAVRPYNVAVVGGVELTATLCTLCMLGLAMAVMEGRGESDLTRTTVGTVMLVIQLIGFLAVMAGAFWVGLRAVWAALGLRRRLRLPPSPADRFADAVHQVMSTDPEISARKYFDRWMVRALGLGLYNRPVWRRETEDLRGLLRATTLPKKRLTHLGSVVRRKTVTPAPPPPGFAAAALAGGSGGSGSEQGSAGGGGTPAAGGGGAPAFNALVQQAQHAQQQQALQRDGSDAVIAVPGDRSPPRERPVQPGTELHRQLSDPALLAAAAARQQPPADQI
ncbi:hypothetical protein ABPG75_000452 [Micractinium tetrahymenae]